MAIFTEQVRENCIGRCSEHTFLFKISKYFISISAFTATIADLANKNPEYTKILAQLIQLKTALSSVSEIQEESLSAEEKRLIAKIISQPTIIEIYVIMQTSTMSQYYTLQEFLEIYARKMSEAKTATEKAKYSNRTVKAVMASGILEKINLLIAELVHPMTPEERGAREYDLTEEEKIQKNLYILKGNFKEGVEDEQLTMGRFYSVPGMIQCHQVFAIDTLTGAIFTPKDIERFASFFSASYQQQEKDAVTLDYVYAVPKQWKEQTVSIPPGYRVFPLALHIYPRDHLSAEANRVITRTEIELFTPCLGELDKAKKRTMDPKLIDALLKLYEDFEKHTQ